MGERYLDTVEVRGSKPLVPTIPEYNITLKLPSFCVHLSFQSTDVLPDILTFMVAVDSNPFLSITWPGVAVPCFERLSLNRRRQRKQLQSN